MSRHAHTYRSAQKADEGLKHCSETPRSFQHPTAAVGSLCGLVPQDVLCCTGACRLPGARKPESSCSPACPCS